MKLDTYDRGTIEWRRVDVLDNGAPVVADIELAVTLDTPTDADWHPAEVRAGVRGVLIDTTTMQPGVHAIRARWQDGADRPQIIAGRIVVA